MKKVDNNNDDEKGIFKWTTTMMKKDLKEYIKTVTYQQRGKEKCLEIGRSYYEENKEKL